MRLTELLYARIDANIDAVDLSCRGSIGIAEYLMEKAGLKEYQAVEVYNHTNGARWKTWAVTVEYDGENPAPNIKVMGAGARLAEIGDRITIAAYMYGELDSLPPFPKQVIVDEPSG